MFPTRRSLNDFDFFFSLNKYKIEILLVIISRLNEQLIKTNNYFFIIHIPQYIIIKVINKNHKFKINNLN